MLAQRTKMPSSRRTGNHVDEELRFCKLAKANVVISNAAHKTKAAKTSIAVII